MSGENLEKQFTGFTVGGTDYKLGFAGDEEAAAPIAILKAPALAQLSRK